jgi:hypothetical protein
LSINGIEAAVDRVVQQLPVAQGVQRDIKAAFVELLERVVSESAQALPPTATTPGASVGTGTQALLPDSLTSAPRFGPVTSALLTNPDLPLLDRLSNDVTAESPLYNEREGMLRGRLNLPELEGRLRASAASMGVEYSATDLEGILRNAGYGAAHLGSSEGYMAAIEKFTGEAYKNYRERAGNLPGANA